MTQHIRSAEQNDMESPLPELPRLRELSRLDRPSANVSRATFARLQHTVNGEPSGSRNDLRVRTWALALGLTVAVPTAFAATPTGGALVERTVQWATSILQMEDSATAPREAAKNSASRGVNAGNVDPASNNSASKAKATLGEGAVIKQGTPTAAFENANEPAAAREPVAPNAELAVGASPEVPKAAPANKPRATGATATPTTALNALPASDVGTLNAERHLRASDARGALALTSRHAALYPDGILSAERQAIVKQVKQLEGQSP
jgi:hypothetical protein